MPISKGWAFSILFPKPHFLTTIFCFCRLKKTNFKVFFIPPALIGQFALFHCELRLSAHIAVQVVLL